MANKTPAQINAIVQELAGQGVRAATRFYQGRLMELISVPAPRRIYALPSGIKKYVATVKATKGAPPRKLSGDLRRSISVEFLKTPDGTVGRCGSNIKYARRLEYEGHPFFVPTLTRHRGAIRTIVVGAMI
jgi:hypothetical protein